MFKIQKINLVVLLLLFGCASTTMEFTSAKTYVRTDKDLRKGEEWALKALNIPSDSTNALVPYFLATEIYKPQEEWEKMAEMLDEAERRNPEQRLEKPKLLVPPEELTKENYDEMVIETIGEGVEAYREDAWGMIFNQALELLDIKETDAALLKLNLCLKMNPYRIETYAAFIQYYIEKDDLKTAIEYAQKGLEINSQSPLMYEMNAKLLLQEFQNNDGIYGLEGGYGELLDQAESMYLKAMDLSDDTSQLKKQLIFVYIDMKENQKAIDISNELLDIYYDDPDLYFNVGVLYQRLATQLYDYATDSYKLFNNDDGKDRNGSDITIEEMYDDFSKAMDYAQKSKEKFLEANDLETEDTGSREAAAEMRKLVKQIKDIYIPSIKEMARTEGFKLD